MTTPIPLPNNPPPPMPIQPGDISASMGQTGNPVLDEISSAHANLSPQAQQAIEGAHGILGISPAHSDPALAASTSPSPEVPGVPESQPRFRSLGMVAGGPDQAGSMLADQPKTARMEHVGPGSMNGASDLVPGMSEIGNTDLDHRPSVAGDPIDTSDSANSEFGLGSSQITAPMPINPHQGEFERLTKPPLPSGDPAAHTSRDTGRPGAEQIHNPWGRGLATVGDVIASGIFPRFGQFVPGTSAYHNRLIGNEKGALGEEQAEAKGQAETAKESAQTKLANQQADTMAEEGKRAPKGNYIPVGDGLFNAETGTWEREPTDKKLAEMIEIDPVKGAALGLKPNKDGKYVIPYQAAGELLKPSAVKEPRESEPPLGEAVPNINAAMTARYQVLHPGAELPKHYVLPPNATKADFDRTDKLIEGEEKAFGTKENQNQTAELRKQTMALAAGNREGKEEAGLKTATAKAFEPALESAERFNVMTKNYEDAIKNHDQQAMLSLLANHLGMTMGLQKGARLNQAIIAEAEKSTPWLAHIGAKFDKDGYLSGLNLTPQQMKQMVDLGAARFAGDISHGRSTSKYLGAKDDGPERIPNRSTMEHYLDSNGNDPARAKAAAAADGWTVK